jgi:hypothetical protein
MLLCINLRTWERTFILRLNKALSLDLLLKNTLEAILEDTPENTPEDTSEDTPEDTHGGHTGGPLDFFGGVLWCVL